jgi:hypothetical protein
MSDEEDTLLASLTEAATADAKKDEKPTEQAEEDKNDQEEHEDTSENAESAEEGSSESEQDAEQSEDVDSESDDVPVKPAKRGASETIRALKAERKQAQADRERLIAENARKDALLEERRIQQEQARTDAQRRAEEERLSLLSPEEKMAYHADQRARSLEQRLNLMQMQMQDNADKAVFHSKAAHDPLVAKYADQVEAMYQEGLRRGAVAPREELLNLVVGREIRKESEKNLSKKKESAKKRIDSATSKPASARSDVAGSKKGKSEEDRLRGVLI